MSLEIEQSSISRRAFLSSAGVAGAGLVGAALLAGCGGSSSSSTSNATDNSIIDTALTFEALAVTTYTNIISSAIYKTNLAGNANIQATLTAAQAEDQIHLNELSSEVGNGPSTTTFYYPVGMFTDAQTTLNSLVTIKEGLIAAYLVGVGQFSTSANRVLAARILGAESDHRVLARVIAAELSLSTVTGLSGQSVSVTPANNYAYEQTFLLSAISDAQTELQNYTTLSDATGAGFSSTPFNYTAVNVGGSPFNNIGS